MDTQKEISRMKLDASIIKLLGGLNDNVQSLKDIIDLLTIRIELLEKEKNE
jgi:hypothetical protein